MILLGEVRPKQTDRRQRERALSEQPRITGNRCAARAASIR